MINTWMLGDVASTSRGKLTKVAKENNRLNLKLKKNVEVKDHSHSILTEWVQNQFSLVKELVRCKEKEQHGISDVGDPHLSNAIVGKIHNTMGDSVMVVMFDVLPQETTEGRDQ
ncbi:hypothetical protein V6N13_125489 [Hibiscus sabdariffa]|uniref:Uncharacterized protein n=1 Tax=Hibiscus sabdariffa TaxID=183260 RepID=A0ABR2U5Y2_9ROSI